MPCRLRVAALCPVLVLATLAPAAVALEGFTLAGNTWTYITPGRTNTGVLLKPAGAGPFPAVLISHGKGGSVSGFTLPKAQVMTNWGFVCIGPEYTHAAGSTVTNQDGASAENIARAAECLTILDSLGYVDTNRIAAYGNSMGAFVSIALAAAQAGRLVSAAVTAGGVTTVPGYAAPSTAMAALVTAPFLILHGTEDTTVFPATSLLFQQILDGNDISNRRVLFQGIDHGLHNNTNTSRVCLDLLREWFVRNGPLAATNQPPTLSLGFTGLTIAAGATSPTLPLAVADAETPAGSLSLLAASTVPGLVAPASVVFGGNGNSRTLTFSTTAGLTGTTTIAVTASDGTLPATILLEVTVTNASLLLPAATRTDQPRGIYVLDGPGGVLSNGVSMRDANIRSNDFVAGYALRVAWTNIEPAMDQFDFTIVDWNVRRLAQAGKKLSLLLMNTDPPWIATTTGVVTWFDAGAGRLRAVPWDLFLQQRFEMLLSAMASHEVDGIALGQHPVLSTVNAGLPGAFLAIRDPAGTPMRTMANYSRANLTNAVLRSLRAAVSNFPRAHVQVGFWPVTDATASPALWEAVRTAILDEFDGVARPKVGFWMENLSASRTAPGVDPIAGKPNTNFAAPLYLSRTNSWANFQALTSWVAPFNNYGDSVTNATPADGMRYAFDTFGSTYFELYVSDIDATNRHPELRRWNAALFPPEQVAVTVTNGALLVGWPSWTGGVYAVERSDDLATWSNEPAAIAVQPWSNWSDMPASSRFYRIRVTP